MAKLIFCNNVLCAEEEIGRIFRILRNQRCCKAVNAKHGVAVNDIYEIQSNSQAHGIGRMNVHYTEKGVYESGIDCELMEKDCMEHI